MLNWLVSPLLAKTPTPERRPATATAATLDTPVLLFSRAENSIRRSLPKFAVVVRTVGVDAVFGALPKFEPLTNVPSGPPPVAASAAGSAVAAATPATAPAAPANTVLR